MSEAGLAGVLAAHQRILDGPGSCRCGEWPPLGHDVEWPAHLTAAVTAWIGERLAGARDDVAEAVAGAVYKTNYLGDPADPDDVTDAALGVVTRALGVEVGRDE